MSVETHNYRIKNSRKHAGELITRIPVGYLKWMVNENHSEAVYAKAELERRGTVTPDVDISGHAINRASLRCLKVWRDTSNKDEGLHAWLCRMSLKARSEGEQLKVSQFSYLGITWTFEEGQQWPVLKSVWRNK